VSAADDARSGAKGEGIVKREDYEGPPCHCEACVMADITDKPIRRDYRSGKWVHGYELKKLYQAEADFWNRVKAISDRKGMR
jgi:hypothetical protein